MATYKEILGKKGKRYQVTIRKKGYKTIYKTFDKKTEAKDWASDVEQQMKKGTWSKVETKEVITPIITLGDLIDDFEKNIAPKKYKRANQYSVMYNWWRNKIGQLNLSEINSYVLTQCKNLLSKEPPDKPYKDHTVKSNSTIRKYMFALSAVLRYADRELEIISRNPMSRVDKPRKSKGIVRFLSNSEKTELIKLCKEHSEKLYLFVILAMFSGGRYSEILNLTVENIDFNNEMIYYVDTKNGEDRGIPLYTKVIELLKNYIEENKIESGHIFIGRKNSNAAYLKGAFEKVVKSSTIENFRFHDLRHTYASYLAKSGATLLEVAELMGHKNLNQVKIYAHLTRKHTSKLVRKMSANEWDFD